MEKTEKKDINVVDIDPKEPTIIDLKARAFDLLSHRDKINSQVNNELDAIYVRLSEIEKK